MLGLEIRQAKKAIEQWPSESREAAQLVIDAYGAPDEISDSLLIWLKPGQWKRIIAYKDFDYHNFPAPHIDCVESFIDYSAPPEKNGELAAFDGSIVVNRTRGEMSARCHDEQANFLALNLANEIVEDTRSVEQARNYYAKEFLAARSGDPTPYMSKLQFTPAGEPYPDQRILSDEQLQEAKKTGSKKAEQLK
jgi:hypothetical protein